MLNTKESDKEENFDSKNFRVWEKFWSENILNSKTTLGPKSQGPKEILGLKEFEVQKILGTKIF